MSDGSAILLSILVIIFTVIIGMVMYKFIRRNIKLAQEEKEVITENAVTKRSMVSSVKYYIKKVDKFGAFVLISVDLDGFGDLNEIFGEKACDQILKEMAGRIVRILPYKGSLCRYEGDEFLIFIKDEDNKDRIEKVAKQILEVVNAPYQVLAGEAISMTCSIGIVTYPTAGENFDDLRKNIELTSYVSKRDGGNKYTSFYATIAEDETDNMAYYREIKNAIANKEFVLYYQPIVNIKERTLVGCEALMRWNHPTKGVQSPATFLKVLEQSGDIRWVGEWGIDTMIKVHNSLITKFPTTQIRISLNLSTKQLLDSNLANTFINIMKKAGAKPEDYMLEISDFMMVEKIGIIKTNIYKLRDFGFKIAVDGFELDGQSVQAVQRAPIDVIKLGRSFLADVNNNYMKERLLEILVKYGQDNNVDIVSEGIENTDIVRYVKNQNVFLGQGYHFARPMGLEAFEDYIEKKQYRVVLEELSNIEDSEAIDNLDNLDGEATATPTTSISEEINDEDDIVVNVNETPATEEINDDDDDDDLL